MKQTAAAGKLICYTFSYLVKKDTGVPPAGQKRILRMLIHIRRIYVRDS